VNRILLPAIYIAALLLVASAVALSLYTFLSARIVDFEVRGRRAGNRLRALKDNVLLRLALPMIHFFTAYALLFKLESLRARLEVWLRQSDEPAGLVPSEVLGISLTCGCLLSLFAGLVVTPLAALPALFIGLYFPYGQIKGGAQGRIRQVSRSIPTMADLIVLSMEAGLDFISSIRLLVAKSREADGRMPIRDELLVVLNQLQLGRTRRDALVGFAQRVPSESVRNFVTAVVHAEEKGMSLRDVLRIQAEVLRHKRVQEAESYISAANVKMLGPIMIVVGALLVVVIVPMVSKLGASLGAGGAAP
jgi:tight adherence protein C